MMDIYLSAHSHSFTIFAFPWQISSALNMINAIAYIRTVCKKFNATVS